MSQAELLATVAIILLVLTHSIAHWRGRVSGYDEGYDDGWYDCKRENK